MTTPVDLLDEIDSTNSEAMRRLATGHREPLWIVARRQTGGKGRDGRRWVSEPGNFYGTLLRPVAAPRGLISQLSLVSGVAVVDALDAIMERRIPGLRLKWPNDLLIGHAKLCGILPESTVIGETLFVAIGIGINVAQPPNLKGRDVASLGQYGLTVDPTSLVAPLGHWLNHWIGLWNAGAGFRVVREAWLQRAGRLGEPITVKAGLGTLEGTYQGLDDDGALLMRQTDGGAQRVTFGDVLLTRERDDWTHGRSDPTT